MVSPWCMSTAVGWSRRLEAGVSGHRDGICGRDTCMMTSRSVFVVIAIAIAFSRHLGSQKGFDPVGPPPQSVDCDHVGQPSRFVPSGRDHTRHCPRPCRHSSLQNARFQYRRTRLRCRRRRRLSYRWVARTSERRAWALLRK